ncbi:MAG: MobQ family relaxase [Sandaracinobacter sp.]
MTVVTAMHHVRTSMVQRSQGHSAVAAAAYRQGERYTDERTGEVHDFRARGGVEDGFIVVPPSAEWALDRERLWNAAEAAERRSNSQTAREFIIGLPHELNKQERREVAEQFARELVQRYGVAVDVAMHAPSPDGDQRNWHCHVLATTRRVDADGFHEKTRQLDDQRQGPREIVSLRERLAQIQNDALRLAQVDRQVDHRSFKERGLDRDADQDHLGRERMVERREVAKEVEEVRRELAAMGLDAEMVEQRDPRAQAARVAEAVDSWIEGAQRQVERLREAAAAQIERAAQIAREKLAQVGDLARDVWQAAKDNLGAGRQSEGKPQETALERVRRIDGERATAATQGPQTASQRLTSAEKLKPSSPVETVLSAAERLMRAESIGQRQRADQSAGETPQTEGQRPRG